MFSAAKSLCGSHGCLQKALTCALELGESQFTVSIVILSFIYIKVLIGFSRMSLGCMSPISDV